MKVCIVASVAYEIEVDETQLETDIEDVEDGIISVAYDIWTRDCRKHMTWDNIHEMGIIK